VDPEVWDTPIGTIWTPKSPHNALITHISDIRIIGDHDHPLHHMHPHTHLYWALGCAGCGEGNAHITSYRSICVCGVIMVLMGRDPRMAILRSGVDPISVKSPDLGRFGPLQHP